MLILHTRVDYCSQQAVYWCVYLHVYFKLWYKDWFNKTPFIQKWWHNRLVLCHNLLLKWSLPWLMRHTEISLLADRLSLSHLTECIMYIIISSSGLFDCYFLWFWYHTCWNWIFSFSHITLQISVTLHLTPAEHCTGSVNVNFVVDLTVISHLHQQQWCWILCWNPSLVFHCALIADWPDWYCRQQSYFLFPVTSCPIFPSLSSPVSQALRVFWVWFRSDLIALYSGLLSLSLTPIFYLLL